MQRAKRCGARTRSGKSCQSPGMANGRCRMHGGSSPGAPKGNQHAYKHGRYTAEAIANRRKFSAMLIGMKCLAGLVCD
ncbi:HGGxSTG domain-containing protein [Bradyrhizobium barranii]|uniref:HGGxSTG domain-containing protein n=1 Tax=Bradyrhizobium barranii TaxID=2992140 RepID=UPI002AB0B4C2|nr:HGGxSTG domain-containing protein [Bradyrhizobium barranii]